MNNSNEAIPSFDEEFCKKMDENPLGVYCVDIYKNGEWVDAAVFSTKAKTDHLIDHHPISDSDALVVPYIIDEPDFGNIAKGKLS